MVITTSDHDARTLSRRRSLRLDDVAVVLVTIALLAVLIAALAAAAPSPVAAPIGRPDAPGADYPLNRPAPSEPWV